MFSDTPHSDVGGAVYNKSDLRRDGIDPVAVTAYIGDLYGLGYITTKILKTCVGYMLDNFTSLLHVRCIDVLFERAYAHSPVRGLDTPYLFHCLGVIRRRSRQVFGKEMSSVSFKNYFSISLSGMNFLRRRRIFSPILFIVSCLERTDRKNLGMVGIQVCPSLKSRTSVRVLRPLKVTTTIVTPTLFIIISGRT